MQRAVVAIALMVLGSAARATLVPPLTDSQLVEAQKLLVEAQTLFAEGLKLKEAGKYAEAVPLAEHALKLCELALGDTHLTVANCLSFLGDLHRRLGSHARAEPLLQRALAIRETALDKNHPAVATSVNNLAILYMEQGLHARAEPLFERALAIREAALGKNHPDVAQSLNNLAGFYVERGLHARAEPLFERALAMREVTLGKHHPDVAQSLNNLATLYLKQGLYARAEPLFERALAIREATLGKHHPDVAHVLANLANLYMKLGLYARAGPQFERALTIREATLGKHHPDVAFALTGLASLYWEQGFYAQAGPLLERALAIEEAALGKNHPEVAGSLNNLAIRYFYQGLYARAKPLFERALAIEEAALGKNHPAVAGSLNNLAKLYMEQGLYARAEPLFERALAIREATLGKHHPDVALSIESLAELRLAQHNLIEALPLYVLAFTASEEHLRQQVFSFSESRLASFLRLLRDDEERLYSLVRAHPNNARLRHLSLSAVLLRKGRSVEEIADTSRIIFRSLGQADREHFERLRALRTHISALSLSNYGARSPANYQQSLKELTDHADAIEEDLSRRSAPLRALSEMPSPNEVIHRVARALPKDGALIEFIAYRDRRRVPTLGTSPPQNSSQLCYLALLLFADGRTRAINLGPADPIDTAALVLHDALAGQSVSYQSAAQALYKLAFRPLLPHLGKARRLFLSPDGQLALVPFAALHDGSRFLVDAWDITYLTSGRDLLPRPKDIRPATSVVVLANPDFNSHLATSPAARAALVSAERSLSLERFFSRFAPEDDFPYPALPGTQKEAESIHHLLPQAQLILGPTATKHALLALNTPGILHIATHGFFREDAVGLLLPDPLLRSGLILAGASSQQAQSGPLGHEHTLVTALELAGMDLWGTQLVVLSACDTGRGAIKLGQGVYGLRRALVVAGAESVVTSLWKVNDETSHELMERYYSNLLAGKGRAEALRIAMSALRQKHPHPYFWAPFILIGRGTPLQGITPSILERPNP